MWMIEFATASGGAGRIDDLELNYRSLGLPV
jgi:hypothetical protein